MKYTYAHTYTYIPYIQTQNDTYLLNMITNAFDVSNICVVHAVNWSFDQFRKSLLQISNIIIIVLLKYYVEYTSFYKLYRKSFVLVSSCGIMQTTSRTYIVIVKERILIFSKE